MDNSATGFSVFSFRREVRRLHHIATRRCLATTGEEETNFDHDESISPDPVNVLGRFDNTVYVAVDS